MGYKIQTSPNTMTTTTYFDNLAILTNNIVYIQPQLNELKLYSNIGLGVSKFVVNGYLGKSKLQHLTFHHILQSTKYQLQNQQLHILSQNEPYTYLVERFVPLLK